jgi:hypothetical protein
MDQQRMTQSGHRDTAIKQKAPDDAGALKALEKYDSGHFPGIPGGGVGMYLFGGST